MRFISGIVFAFVLAGCSPKSPRGFSLPEGNAEAGKVAFLDLGCVHCHRLPSEPDDSIRVLVGGPVTRLETYGMLVSSIVDPAHKISDRATENQLEKDGSSPMATAQLNESMTVAQLVDLVAWLHPLYEVVPPEGAYSYGYP